MIIYIFYKSRLWMTQITITTASSAQFFGSCDQNFGIVHVYSFVGVYHYSASDGLRDQQIDLCAWVV